jgi:hypothetical protein
MEVELDKIISDKRKEIRALVVSVNRGEWLALGAGVLLFLGSGFLIYRATAVVGDADCQLQGLKGVYYSLISVAGISLIASIILLRSFVAYGVREKSLHKELLNLDDLRVAWSVANNLEGPAAYRAKQEIVNTVLGKCE